MIKLNFSNNISIQNILTSGGCPKSMLLNGDGTQDSSKYEKGFGIYNFMKYDHNHDVVYVHSQNPQYTLSKMTLENEIEGWFVSHLSYLKNYYLNV